MRKMKGVTEPFHVYHSMTQFSSFKTLLGRYGFMEIKKYCKVLIIKGRTCFRRSKIEWFSGIFMTGKNSMDIF